MGNIKHFYKIKNYIFVDKKLLYLNNTIIVPNMLRKTVFELRPD